VVRTPGEDSAMNPYAASKAAAWAFCRMFARTQEWPVVGAKLFQTYGPGQGPRYLVTGALAAALVGEDFRMTEGTQERDWIYVTDAAAGLRAVRDGRLPSGESIDLGSGQTASVAEVVRLAYAVAGGAGRPLPGALPTRPGEEPLQVADAARARALLGWETAVSLPQGLGLLRDHLLDQQG
jgi:nucleoside-diphosphate-sugar epimerase